MKNVQAMSLTGDLLAACRLDANGHSIASVVGPARRISQLRLTPSEQAGSCRRCVRRTARPRDEMQKW
jgi:hypothetical protein